MDQNRMKERNCNYINVQRGKLMNYKLVFNKKSIKNPQCGFGNIVASDGDYVEGLLYELLEEKMKFLDKYEGFPRHYDRKEIEIDVENGKINAQVYVATEEWISENLKPSKEYLDHFLAAKDFLSERYYLMLKNITTL